MEHHAGLEHGARCLDRRGSAGVRSECLRRTGGALTSTDQNHADQKHADRSVAAPAAAARAETTPTARDVTAALRALRDDRRAAEVVIDRRARWAYALQVLAFVGLAILLYRGALWFSAAAEARVADAEARAAADARLWAESVAGLEGSGAGAPSDMAGVALAAASDAVAEPPVKTPPEPPPVDSTAPGGEPVQPPPPPTRRVRRTVTYQSVPATRTRGTIRWLDGAAEFRRVERSFRNGSDPLLIYVHTDWCTWCAAVDRDLWADGQVAGVVGSTFTALRINPDDGPNEAFIARSYRVRGYPAVFVKASPTAPLVRMQVLSNGSTVSPGGFARALRDEAARR